MSLTNKNLRHGMSAGSLHHHLPLFGLKVHPNLFNVGIPPLREQRFCP
jgi:hypothetical protein